METIKLGFEVTEKRTGKKEQFKIDGKPFEIELLKNNTREAELLKKELERDELIRKILSKISANRDVFTNEALIELDKQLSEARIRYQTT